MSLGVGKFSHPIGQAAWTQPHNFARGATNMRPSGSSATDSTQNSPAAGQISSTGKIDRSHLPQNVTSVSFDDFVDVLNPLQHVPVLSDLYRTATGDKISGLARVAGGFLYGGMIGGLVSFAAATYEQVHGMDPGETVIAMLGNDGQAGVDNAPQTPPPAMLAQTDTPSLATTGGVAALRPAEPQNAAASPPAAVRLASATEPLTDRIAQRHAAEPHLATITDSGHRIQSNRVSTYAARAIPSNPIPSNQKMDQKTLGTLMHEKAQTASGTKNPLPPDLVHDMMLMALDRYQQTAALTPTAK